MTGQRVTVPVPAEMGVEDRLAGSLTFRHAAYLAVAAAGVAVMLLGDRSPGAVAVGALVAAVGVTGAAVRPYGEPLDRLVPAAIAYLRRRRAERHRAGPAADESPAPTPPSEPITDAAADASRPKPRRAPVRTLALLAALVAVAAVAVARWPRPAPPPAPQVVVVPVPIEVPDPGEEAIDDAVDAWIGDLLGT